MKQQILTELQKIFSENTEYDYKGKHFHSIEGDYCLDEIAERLCEVIFTAESIYKKK